MNQPPSSEELYNDIVNKIISLELKPGEKISENKMCMEYNVSRSVIRNVFARLNQINLIEVFPQRGTFVNRIDLDYIHTVLVMRLAIEKEMITRFMQLEDKEKILKKLRENLDKQKKYKDMDTYIDEFKRLDEEFHEIIMYSVEKYNIMDLMNEHLIHISRWRKFSVNVEGRVHELVEEHERILEGMEKGDLDYTLKSITDHLETVSVIVNLLLVSYKDYLSK